MKKVAVLILLPIISLTACSSTNPAQETFDKRNSSSPNEDRAFLDIMHSNLDSKVLEVISDEKLLFARNTNCGALDLGQSVNDIAAMTFAPLNEKLGSPQLALKSTDVILVGSVKNHCPEYTSQLEELFN